MNPCAQGAFIDLQTLKPLVDGNATAATTLVRCKHAMMAVVIAVLQIWAALAGPGCEHSKPLQGPWHDWRCHLLALMQASQPQL